MAFPINNFYNYFNKFDSNKIFNLYLNRYKQNKSIDKVDPFGVAEVFQTNTSTPKKKRPDSERPNRLNYKMEKPPINKQFIDLCDDIKKTNSINKEINKYNLKRQNYMNINNINFININSTLKNICPSVNKLLERTNYNKKMINLYNKDNTHGAWSIGTTDRVYKYRNFFNNKFNY